MIPIFSVESDLSTSDVIDWILYFNECCFRINNINDLNSFLEQYPILTIPTKKKFSHLFGIAEDPTYCCHQK